MDTFGELLFSQTAVTLLRRLRADELTYADFLKECAYWAIKDGFDEIRPLPLPTPPNTEAYREYEALPPERRRKVDQKFFYEHLEINAYYSQVLFVKQRNKANLGWLIEIGAYIPQEDTINLARIDEKILELRAWLNENPIIVEKAKEIFRVIEPPKRYGTAGDVIKGYYD